MALAYKLYNGIDLIECLTQDAQTSSPRLQELQVLGNGSLLDRRMLLEAPKLRTITVVDANLNFMSPNIGVSSLTILRYNLLQDVQLMDCDGLTWCSLFQAMQSDLFPAVSFVRTHAIASIPWTQIPATYSLPGQQNIIAQLTHLCVGDMQKIVNNFNGLSYWRTIMSSLYFPNLGTLTLSAFVSDGNLDAALFSALHELDPKRTPNLRSFSVCSQYTSENFDLIGQYLEPLSGFTSLHHLTIHWVKIQPSASDPPQNIVLPPLVSITIWRATIYSSEPFFQACTNVARLSSLE